MSGLEDEVYRRTLCDKYAKLQQNILSSGVEEEMERMKAEAENAGWTFQMTNEQAYMQPNALVKPKYKLVRLELEDEFADAVAAIPAEETGLEQ